MFSLRGQISVTPLLRSETRRDGRRFGAVRDRRPFADPPCSCEDSRIGKAKLLGALLILAAGASAATAAFLTGTGSASEPQVQSAALSRVERTFSRSWRSSCDFDVCTIASPFQVAITTPADRATVDVTVTVTLDYATSRGTAARAAVTIDAGAPPNRNMAPGAFPLAPSRRLTSTTLTWVRTGLPASGRTYTFHGSVSPRSIGRESQFFVRGQKLTVVAETWSAGD
jgi:hypothetical protein